ncbi:MAG TPA: stage II sporulation protein P [Firmicutes bacterium]|nr:stage II sporulation protein P [Bacillota bacterium]
MKKTQCKGIAGLLLVSLAILTLLFLLPGGSPIFAHEELKDGYFTIKDIKTGKTIMQTGIVVRKGDRFLDHDNHFYEVTKIDGQVAFARLVEVVDLTRKAREFEKAMAAEWKTEAETGSAKMAQGGPRMVIATYHTHSDESYIPTDGAASIEPRGGIYRVGATLTSTLERYGVNVHHSYAIHLPHDGAAYERSRRTAVQLLKSNPDALFDIHRDAAPLEQYATTIGGAPGARVMIVVGRENPNMSANEQFAWAIKSVADREFPGLIRGIFYGAGGYNQDLSPRALLFEVGSQENSRYAAERSVAVLTNALPRLLYGITGPPPEGRTPAARREQVGRAARESSGALVGVFWIVVSLLVIGATYLFINEGSWAGVKKRLSRLLKLEFLHLIGVNILSRHGNDKGDMTSQGRGQSETQGKNHAPDDTRNRG